MLQPKLNFGHYGNPPKTVLFKRSLVGVELIASLNIYQQSYFFSSVLLETTGPEVIVVPCHGGPCPHSNIRGTLGKPGAARRALTRTIKWCNWGPSRGADPKRLLASHWVTNGPQWLYPYLDASSWSGFISFSERPSWPGEITMLDLLSTTSIWPDE